MDARRRRRHVLLSRFKLLLADGAPAAVAAALPPGLPKERVISEFLGALHRMGVEWLTQRSGFRKVWDPDTASYTLTVPANWSHEAKATMRRCAHQAGIIPIPESPRLQLLHEPEAAAIAMVREQKPFLKLKKGDTILVCDLGGGTADITLHELVPGAGGAGGSAARASSGGGSGGGGGSGLPSPDHLREVACRRAEFAGSTFVDDNFEAWVAEELGLDTPQSQGALGAASDDDNDAGGRPAVTAYEAWKFERPRDYLRLMKAWEAEKCAFPGGEGQRDSKIQLPLSLWKRLPDDKKVQLYADEDEDDEEEAQQCVRVPAAVMEEVLFKPVVDVILEAARPMTHWEGGQVDYVFAAGGFSGSKYVMRRLEAELGAAAFNPGVLVTAHPGEAVLQGAALYGDNPRLIAGRVSLFAYGVRAGVPFQDGMPGEPTWCRFGFSCFVSKGQSVGADDEVSQVFSTLSLFQMAAEVELFCTPNNAEEFTTDPGMRRLGAVTLALPQPHVAGRREFKVTFRFGEAELKVSAADLRSGEAVHTQVQFVAGG